MTTKAPDQPDPTRPPIPVTCAARPVVGGVVVPWGNIRLADGGADFRRHHDPKFVAAWRHGRCQVHGGPAGQPTVLFGGPRQLATGQYTEPPVCAPCAVYTSRACPMVGGRLTRYGSGQSVAEGRRGSRCDVPGCGCGGWTESFVTAEDHAGAPAHPYYAVYIPAGAWVVTAHQGVTVCADRGCRHRRVIIDGGMLTAAPLKIIHVSEPGQGRTWTTTARGDQCLPWIRDQFGHLAEDSQ